MFSLKMDNDRLPAKVAQFGLKTKPFIKNNEADLKKLFEFFSNGR